MLVVGEAAMQQINPDIKPYITDILVSDINIKKLCLQLGIEGVKPTSISDSSSLYFRKKDGKKFLLHNTKSNLYLEKLIRNSIADKRLKIASPAVNYAYMWTLSNLRFKNPMTWIKNVEIIKELEPYFKDTFKYNILSGKIYMRTGKNIANHFLKMNNIYDTPAREYPFEIIDKYEILKAVTLEQTAIHSYKRMTINNLDHYYIENIFRRALNKKQKHTAIMDLIYINSINEFFLPELYIYDRFPINATEWKTFFIETLMNICTDNKQEHYFIKEYILNNIHKIMSSFEIGAYRSFIEMYHAKQIKRKDK